MNDCRHKYAFPRRAGSSRNDLTNPALEFAKTVTWPFKDRQQQKVYLDKMHTYDIVEKWW